MTSPRDMLMGECWHRAHAARTFGGDCPRTPGLVPHTLPFRETTALYRCSVPLPVTMPILYTVTGYPLPLLYTPTPYHYSLLLLYAVTPCHYSIPSPQLLCCDVLEGVLWGVGSWDPKLCVPKKWPKKFVLQSVSLFPTLVRSGVGGGGGAPMPQKCRPWEAPSLSPTS